MKSEGQTPVSTDEPFRVSRTSSLDQLPLLFQQQKKNTGRFRAELGRLRQKFIDARQELNAERSSRRKLEEWTNFLENQLETFIKSRSLVDKQYVFLRHGVQLSTDVIKTVPPDTKAMTLPLPGEMHNDSYARIISVPLILLRICFQCPADHPRSAHSSNQEAEASPMKEARRALVDQLLNEMYRCCDRLRVPGETALHVGDMSAER